MRMFFSAAHANSLTRGIEVPIDGVTYIYRPQGEQKISFRVYETETGEILPATIIGYEVPPELQEQYPDYVETGFIKPGTGCLVGRDGPLTDDGLAIAKKLNMSKHARQFKKQALENLRLKQEGIICMSTASFNGPAPTQP